VDSLAAQLAIWAGAHVIGTVRTEGQKGRVPADRAAAVVALDDPDARGQIRAAAPEGVDRLVEIAGSTVSHGPSTRAGFASRWARRSR
jgi:NADPH2:quinone reductase